MRMTVLTVHIITGALAILSGFVALYAVAGSRWLDIGLMLVSLDVGLFMFTSGVESFRGIVVTVPSSKLATGTV